MSSFNDRLYNLIPTIYRIRDEESDGPLRALLSVISQEVDVVQRDMEQLYDNWFIETCDEWVIPYIGELVGHKPVIPTNGEITDPHVQARNHWLFPRREIANIVRYRRRKGTLPVLEEIANDTAGWLALAVEFRKKVAATPNLRHGDKDSVPKLPDFRDRDHVDHLSGPFSTVGHTVNFRAMQAAERSKTEGVGNGQDGLKSYGLPIAPKSVGLWVWRNSVDSITGVTPGCRVHQGKRYFTFHPLGVDIPLYNLPKRPKDPEELAMQCELPIQLSRTLLATGKVAHPDKNYYAAGRSLVIRIRGDQACRLGLSLADKDTFIEIPANSIQVRTLGKSVINSLNENAFPEGIEVILDPELGRFVVKCALQAPVCDQDFNPEMLQVTYHHSVGGDLGGGEYHRVRDPKRKLATWVVTPTKPPVRTDGRCPAMSPDPLRDPDKPKAPIDQAFDLLLTRLAQVAAPNTPADQRHLILELAETGVYRLKEKRVLSLPRNVTVELRAAARVCPFLISATRANCEELPLKIELHPGARLIIDGLVIEAEGICVTHVPERVASKPAARAECSNIVGVDGVELPQPSRVMLRHATLVPRSCQCGCDNARRPRVGSLIIGHGVGEVCLDHAITGAIESNECAASCGCDSKSECQCTKNCPSPAVRLKVLNSVVDGQGGAAIGCPATVTLDVQRSTLLGSVNVQTISLMDNSIATSDVLVERTQIGMVRFSNVPGCYEKQPLRLRCQPVMVDKTSKGDGRGQKGNPIRSLTPSEFQSLCYSSPGYCQLRQTAPSQVRRGADDGGEMGVFHDQFIPHRELALERRLAEFTPATHTLTILYAEEYQAATPVEDK